MIEVTNKTLQFQFGLFNQQRLKIRNICDHAVTFKIRCNNNANYKLDCYFGLILSRQDIEIGVKNLEAADLKLVGDQFEIQYAQLIDLETDLKEFWKNRKSLDNIIISVEVIDIQQQQKDQVIVELQQRIQTQSQDLQKIKEKYSKTQKSAVDIHYFNQFQDGFTVGQVLLVIVLSLFFGGIFR